MKGKEIEIGEEGLGLKEIDIEKKKKRRKIK